MNQTRSFLLIAALICGGCGFGEPTTVKSKDGVSQVTMPGSWSRQSDLHDKADLQIANPWRELYLVVLTESKQDFDEDLTYEDHASLTMGSLRDNLKNGEVSEAKTLQIGGRPAVQYEVRGSAEGINIVYLHTTVDGEKHFHQMLAWTLKSKYSTNRAALVEVLNSFKER